MADMTREQRLQLAIHRITTVAMSDKTPKAASEDTILLLQEVRIATAPINEEAEAGLFADYCENQFHHDGRPIRCDCCNGVCWVDEQVSKHWLTWKAARNIGRTK